MQTDSESFANFFEGTLISPRLLLDVGRIVEPRTEFCLYVRLILDDILNIFVVYICRTTHLIKINSCISHGSFRVRIITVSSNW